MNIILFGPPGAGKGTQCAHLAAKYDLYKLSTGDMIRQEIRDQTELGRKVKEIVEAGKFPDTALINKMVVSCIERNEESKGFVFDGYPRTLEQGLFLDDYLIGRELKLDCIIMLEVNEDHLVSRILNRYTCASCGAIYSSASHKPEREGVCDVCGGKDFVHRADDTEQVIRTRFDTYRRETEEIIQYYDQKNLLIKIDGNQAIERVTQLIDRVVDDKQAELKSKVC